MPGRAPGGVPRQGVSDALFPVEPGLQRYPGCGFLVVQDDGIELRPVNYLVFPMGPAFPFRVQSLQSVLQDSTGLKDADVDVSTVAVSI
eukprot:7484055-Pyramimonas_sp.AAC.1